MVDDPDVYAVSAYCVVDNDFAPAQYGTGQTPQEFLEVTSIHRRSRSPLVRRILAQLARELLLLESSDWPFLITTRSARDYAEARVKEHIAAFDRLRTMLGRAKDGSSAPDDGPWLAEMEKRDSPFPKLDPGSWTLKR